MSSSVAGTLPTSNNANGVITMNTHGGNYYAQLGFSSNGKLYHRYFNGIALNNTMEWAQVYTSQSKPTPADIGAAASSHSHAAGTITAGTLIAGVVATNSTDYTTYRLRNIAANTTALTANSSTLTNGTIYLQYE